jgi:hypothetical protein
MAANTRAVADQIARLRDVGCNTSVIDVLAHGELGSVSVGRLKKIFLRGGMQARTCFILIYRSRLIPS